MFKTLRTALVIGALLACYGIGVLWYWDSTHRAISGQDLFIYLLLIPAALLALLGLTVLIVKKLKSEPRARTDEQNQPASDANAASAKGPSYLKIFDSSVITPLGDDWASINEALTESPVGELDDNLTSEEGIPWRSRRKSDLDDMIAADEPDSIDFETDDDAETRPGAADVGEATLRGGLLLGQAIGALPLLAQLAYEMSALVTPTQTAKTVDLHPAWSGAAVASDIEEPRHAKSSLPKKLYVYLLIDASLGQADSIFMQDTARFHLQAHGFASPLIELETVSCRNDAQAYHLVEEIRSQAEIGSEPSLWLLLSGTSNVSQAVAEQWEAQGELQIVKGQQVGSIPGEAGAALLLGNDRIKHPALKPRSRISPVLQSEDAPIADRGSASGAGYLTQLWSRLGEKTQLTEQDLACAMADCAGLSLHAAELGRFVTEQMPRLLDEDAVTQLGSAWGNCMPASALATLAAAADASRTGNHTVLLAGFGPRLKRSMCAVRPEPEETASA